MEEMFNVTHIKESTNAVQEERWIEPSAPETYVRTPVQLIFFCFHCIDYIIINRVHYLYYRIGLFEYLRNIVVLYLFSVGTDHLYKNKMRIFRHIV